MLNRKWVQVNLLKNKRKAERCGEFFREECMNITGTPPEPPSSMWRKPERGA
jgi:hypothetical protein